MENKWTYNECEDSYWNNELFGTKEELISILKKDYLHKEYNHEVYIGKCVKVALPTYVDVDSIFEKLNENYAEECFEYDDYLFDDVTREDAKWLEEKMSDLMQEFYKKIGLVSPCYTIEDIEVVKL